MASESQANNSEGTVIITGANGSVAFWFVQNLLQNYPTYSAILAVRDASPRDPNTAKLQGMVSRFDNSKVLIESVDLGSLASVRSFTDSVIQRVSTQKLPPIIAIVCNAFNWSLTGQQNSPDGLDLSFQVSHLSHFVLVLKLLGSMDKRIGRLVFLGSDAHDSKTRNAFNTIGAAFPEDIEELITPPADRLGEEQAQGFRRYGNAKLANVMFMHTLNRKLLQDPSLKNITALAMDPGGIPSSRAFNNVPRAFRAAMLIAGFFVAPVAKHFANAVNTPQGAGQDLAALSLGSEGRAARGYFQRQKPFQSSAESQDEPKQMRLWAACMKWGQLTISDSVLN